jgi:hypothetical protein
MKGGNMGRVAALLIALVLLAACGEAAVPPSAAASARAGVPAATATPAEEAFWILVEAPASPTMPPPRTVLPVADAVAVGQGYTVTLHAVADPAPPGPYLLPHEVYRVVAFDVTVTNSGPATHGFFEVTGTRNEGYPQFFPGVAPVFLPDDLPPGASARGWVTFNVRVYDVLTTLTYTTTRGTRGAVTFALR